MSTIYPLSDLSIRPLSPSSHPHLILHFPPESLNTSKSKSKKQKCHKEIYLSLPDSLFIDRDELLDTWPYSPASSSSFPLSSSSLHPGLGSKGILQWHLEPPAIDIERPIKPSSQVTKSTLHIAISDDIQELDILLHTRYLEPNEKGYEGIILIGSSEGEEGSNLNVGNLRAGRICYENGRQFERLKDPSSLPIYNNCNSSLPITITLPTGISSHQLPVEIITALTILLGWVYLFRKIYHLLERTSRTTISIKTKIS